MKQHTPVKAVRILQCAACVTVISFLCQPVEAAVIIQQLTSASDGDAILADPDISVTASARFQSGSGGYTSREIRIGNFDTFTDEEDQGNNDFLWNNQGTNDFSLVYDSSTGNLEMTVAPLSGSFSVYCTPTDWFDQVLITLHAPHASDCVFTGTFDDEDFSITTFNWGSSGIQSGGILFTLPDNNAGNVASFVIQGTLDIQSLMEPGHVFPLRGDITLLRPIPEPSSSVLVVAGVALAATMRRKVKKAQQDRGGNALPRAPHD